MNPYISWAIVLVVAGSLGWYYSEVNTKPKNPAKAVLEKAESVAPAKKQKRKAKKSPETAPAAVSEKPTFEFKAPEEDEVPDEEIDHKEMAKRFAAVKNGTSATQFASSESKSQKKKKSKTAANLEPSNGERSASRVSTRTSSTTGADADDDLSSAGSPMVNPTAAGYVSDMLEAPAPGASVLRVTGNVDSNSQKKKAKAEKFKEVETKKQRQQRQKNEARKQEVQAAEEQRRKLLEKQLHTAREAERREAKSVAANAAANAWAPKSTNGTPRSSPKPEQAPKVELLDTFEPSSTSTQSPATSQQWNQGLPSEEEQMRILGAGNGDDAWTTVGTKKPKKKSGKADESEVSASESQPTPAAPTPVEPKVKVTPTYLPDILRSNQKGHPLDSDWAA
ncbi:uncharacterized protein DSM5745_06567 [Aspergillus mulundensis]|uniref:Uncharacterized protein n=1 Tax=Aspergillus mulundensis TaxID=1810919 RepID=A0A3D8RRE6_9EURO|nr:Uncharacterized protein DSM5745_06567 [Aspergillus mulundensis]RDW76575.1 Uncharacterized protein DSM5745_06567 [Aspergillus mulundensis]